MDNFLKHRLRLFREMADTVPAYRDFLKKNKIKAKDIRSEADLKKVPAMTKTNYLRVYAREMLCLGGSLKRHGAIYAATSGSTGIPFYFPRNEEIDKQSAYWHKIFLENVSGGKKIPTLVIDCFGMGVWIGGLITFRAFRYLAEDGYPVSIITPGANKHEIFNALKNIAAHYSQVVLCGYPPFIKDVIDEAEGEKIDLKKLNVKLLFAAEGFSDKFREYVASKVGIKNTLTGTANIYGTVDLGTMAMETPLSILVRSVAIKNKKIFEALFSNINKTPTLAQFNPTFTDFEIEDESSSSLGQAGNILCSGRNIIPLFKYAVGDHGGVLSFKKVVEIFKKEGLDLEQLAKKHGIKNILGLPFVYVYERADFSTKLYGAIIYPEHIKQALLHETLGSKLTGKFTIETVRDKNENQYLQIHIEFKPGQKGGSKLEKHISKLIVDALLLNNAEYAYLSGMIPDKVIPKLTLWPYEHPEYFKKGGKQKWAR